MEPVIIITTEENKKSILRENSRKHIFYNLKFYTFLELKRICFLIMIIKRLHLL